MVGSRLGGLKWVQRFNEDWPTAILRPVVVNLLTAVLLFFIAILFKPVILDLIHGAPLKEYPVICTAEPYPGDNPGELRVDFFIINRVARAQTHADLATFLKTRSPDPDRPLSPGIVLKVDKNVSFEANGALDFNHGKGNLVIKTNAKERTIQIRIVQISARAIMKVVIIMHDLPHVSPDLSRMAKSQIRFDHTGYLDGCYKKS